MNAVVARPVARRGLEQRLRAGADLVPRLSASSCISAAWALLALAGIARLRRLGGHAIPPGADGRVQFRRRCFCSDSCVVQGLPMLYARGPRRTLPARTLRARLIGHAPADPDIYFIVLDGYARADVLAEYYGFDNWPFIQRTARARIPGQRRQPIELLLDRSCHWDRRLTWITSRSLGRQPARYRQPGSHRCSIDCCAITAQSQFLRERGYRFVHLQSTWGGTARIPMRTNSCPAPAGLFGNEYLRAVADASWLRALGSQASIDIASCHLQNFDTLAGASAGARPEVRVRPLRAAASSISL